MDVMNLHHLAVPCIAKEKESDHSVYSGQDVFYLNPSAIIRYEPNGATITPPMLYSSFLSVDGEMMELLRQRHFSGQGIPNYIISLLLENEVIVRGMPSAENRREIQTDICGLPTQVLLDVTSYCNCDCLACYHHADLNGYEPPLEHVISRISRLKDLGLMMYEVTGGEPFSRADLCQVFTHIKQLGLHFYVVTNGEYLADISSEMVAILKTGLGVAVSLDGVGEVHDRIRRRRGLYGKMTKGLDFLCSQGIKVYFISTLTKESLSCVGEMVEVAKRYGTTIHFRPAIKTGAAVINAPERIDLASELGDLLLHPNVRNGLLNTKKFFPRSRYFGCGLRKRISVDSRGNLYPCVMDRSRSSLSIDELSPVGLVDKLEQEAKVFLAAHQECKSCVYNKEHIRCGGFCRFSNCYRNKLGEQ